MNSILFIIFYIILSNITANPANPKLCIDCKFFKKDFFTSNKYSVCSLFPRVPVDSPFLVDGKKRILNDDYYFCSISREYEFMCGKEGKLYQPKK